MMSAILIFNVYGPRQAKENQKKLPQNILINNFKQTFHSQASTFFTSILNINRNNDEIQISGV